MCLIPSCCECSSTSYGCPLWLPLKRLQVRVGGGALWADVYDALKVKNRGRSRPCGDAEGGGLRAPFSKSVSGQVVARGG